MSLEGLTESQRDQLAKGMQALLNGDPEVSKGTKRLLKKIDPKLNFPELELEDVIEARVKPLADDLQKQRDELAERRFREQTESEHAKVRARGFKVDDVQKLMKDRGIVSFDTAMDMMDMEQRLAAPTPEALSGVYEMPEDQKEIFKNPAQWARKQAHSIIDQFKRRPASAR